MIGGFFVRNFDEKVRKDVAEADPRSVGGRRVAVREIARVAVRSAGPIS